MFHSQMFQNVKVKIMDFLNLRFAFIWRKKYWKLIFHKPGQLFVVVPRLVQPPPFLALDLQDEDVHIVIVRRETLSPGRGQIHVGADLWTNGLLYLTWLRENIVNAVMNERIADHVIQKEKKLPLIPWTLAGRSRLPTRCRWTSEGSAFWKTKKNWFLQRE